MPARDYGYDAIYRLSEASGREHIGQSVNRHGIRTPFWG